MILVVLPDARPRQVDDVYAQVKTEAAVNLQVSTQCVLSNTLTKKHIRSIATNIALQMQCKLGGAIWWARFPEGLGASPFMVVGIDVFYDTVNKKHSYAGIVASMDKKVTKFYSTAQVQMRGQELLTHLNVSFTKCLKAFHGKYRKLPQTIYVYRDGVGEGQMEAVEAGELQQMKEAAQTLYSQCHLPTPKFMVVIVQKRILARLFGSKGGRYENPRPGSIVDNTVTRWQQFDFLLVSQSVREGTVSPTHYTVLVDETNSSVDQVQNFTYALTHLYYNWPGTIRVPAPCQYAHKLAKVMGQSIHDAELSPSMADKLWYL